MQDLYFKIILLKKIIPILFLINLISAQDNHHEIWSKFSVDKSFSEKIKGELEYQIRFQDNATIDNGSIKYPLLSSVRIWGSYNIDKHFSMLFSPFAYFQISPLIAKETDLDKKKVYENRYTLMFEYKNELLKKTSFMNRFGFEYRDFKNTSLDYFRMREKGTLKFDLNSKVAVLASDEVFFNMTSKENTKFFDQNRVSLLLNYSPIKDLRFEVGGLFCSKNQKMIEQNIHENVLIFNTCVILDKKREKNGN